jgi:uncharacterized protein
VQGFFSQNSVRMDNKNINFPIYSPSGNNYFLCGEKKHLLTLHPLCVYFYEICKKGYSVKREYLTLKDHEIIINNVKYSPIELKYYYKKFIFLKRNKYFEEIQGYDKIHTCISAASIFESMANSNQILFEVTEKCNLKCYYCAYGELYNSNPMRKFENIDFEIVDIFFRFYVSVLAK